MSSPVERRSDTALDGESVNQHSNRAQGGHHPHMGAPFGPYLWIALSHLLLPCLPEDPLVQQVLTEPNRITIVTEPRSLASLCPLCGHASERVHSHYL
jgi:hypothetical protein